MNKPEPNISNLLETEDGSFRITVSSFLTFGEPTCNGRIYYKESMPDILQQMKEKDIFLYETPYFENVCRERPIGILDKDSISASDCKIGCDFVISDEYAKEFIREESENVHVYPSFVGYLDQTFNPPGVTAFVLEPKLISFSIEVL